MIPAYKEELDDLRSFFYGYRWIQNTVLEYRQGKCKLPSLRGKRVIFPEREFTAALMHLYLGGFSLSELADMTAISLAEVTFLRTQIDFMMLVDAAKASFARHFRDSLLLNEYPPVGYASIAAEYTTFEELVKNQIRFPLIRRMINYANSILDKDRHSLPINPCDLTDFHIFWKAMEFHGLIYGPGQTGVEGRIQYAFGFAQLFFGILKRQKFHEFRWGNP
jgi:hypothetical protein